MNASDRLPTEAGAGETASLLTSARRRRVLRGALDDLRQRLPLGELSVSSLVTVAEVFTEHCSPADAGPEALKTAALFMYGIVGLNEGVSRLGHTSRVRQYLQGFSNECVGASVWQQLGAELRKALAKYAGEWERVAFSQALCESLGASVWEAEHLEAWPRDYCQYTTLRHRTIGVQPFLELWKLLGALHSDEQLGVGSPLAHIELISGQVQFLANDLESVERDVAQGQLNAVPVLARERGVSHEVARAELSSEVERLGLVLAAEIDRLRELVDDSPRLKWYLEVVARCTRGNVLAMRELSERYRGPAT